MITPGDPMTDERPLTGGAGPLYPQTPAAMAAAERPVEIPGTDDADTADRDTSNVAETDHATGEHQATENRDNEPPA
jgi:hypothetical protein